jgi:DNA polymerase III delta prime subunit
MRKEVKNAFLKNIRGAKRKFNFNFNNPFPSMLLETILSRVQEIKFSLVSREDI